MNENPFHLHAWCCSALRSAWYLMCEYYYVHAQIGRLFGIWCAHCVRVKKLPSIWTQHTNIQFKTNEAKLKKKAVNGKYTCECVCMRAKRSKKKKKKTAREMQLSANTLTNCTRQCPERGFRCETKCAQPVCVCVCMCCMCDDVSLICV